MFIATSLASLLLLVPLRRCCDFTSPNRHLNHQPSVTPPTTLFHVGVVGVCADSEMASSMSTAIFFMATKDVCMWLWLMPCKDFEIYQKPRSCILCLPMSHAALCFVGWLVRRVP